ncbi:MAG: hypothetical protein ACJAUI_001256 [Pseudohongiellaceae bacterium]|jgi:hypothetical protein
MNWEAIGAIGEIIGAFGVVVTLFYVAYQVRQNTKQTDLNTMALEEASDEAMANLSSIARWKVAENEDVARIYTAGFKDPHSLTEIDLVRFRSICAGLLQIFQLVHAQSLHNRTGSFDWDSTKPTIVRMFNSPGGRWYWENYQQEWSVRFRDSVTEILGEDET